MSPDFDSSPDEIKEGMSAMKKHGPMTESLLMRKAESGS